MPHSHRAQSRYNLRCTSCGYGVLVRLAPDRCPMCGETVWEHAGPELLSRVLHARVRGVTADPRELFRQLNEDIAAHADAEEFELVCECDDGRCFAAVRVAHEDFRALLATPEHHLVVPGHERNGEERIVFAGGRFAIVEDVDAAVPGRVPRGQ